MFVGLGAQADFFDLNLGLGLAGFTLFFGFLVEELAEIHHPAYGWVGGGGDFNQI